MKEAFRGTAGWSVWGKGYITFLLVQLVKKHPSLLYLVLIHLYSLLPLSVCIPLPVSVDCIISHSFLSVPEKQLFVALSLDNFYVKFV